MAAIEEVEQQLLEGGENVHIDVQLIERDDEVRSLFTLVICARIA